MDAELKAIFERGRQAIQARADLDIADLDRETRLRAAVCECGGCEFVRGMADADAKASDNMASDNETEAAQ